MSSLDSWPQVQPLAALVLVAALANCGSGGAPSNREGDTALGSADECQVTNESNLGGVRIEIPEPRCLWTLDDIKNGVQLKYQLVVEREIPGFQVMRPTPQSIPGPDGLMFQEALRGKDKTLYGADSGFPGGGKFIPERTLPTGTFARSIGWPQKVRNTSTDNPCSDCEYEMEVYIEGTIKVDGQRQLFRVSASLPIRFSFKPSGGALSE